MLVVFSAVAKSQFAVTEAPRRTKSSSTVRNFSTRNSSAYRSEDSYQSQPQFALEGKPVYLQQRISLVTPVRENIHKFKIQNKTYSCVIEKVTEDKKTRETKLNTKRISGGVRRASIRRRQEQQKPTTEVVYQQRAKRKSRKTVTVRQPLAMSVMSLPGKHLPRYCSCEEATQVFPTTEEAKATLKRLLASRNHESMMSESISNESKLESSDKGGLLEKPAYLEDTYDYLFNRHVQTLNGVIKRQEQEKLDEANGISQQKYRKQIIQLCCREGGDNSAGEEDTSVIVGSTKSSTRQNSSNTLRGGAENDCCNNNNLSQHTSCSCSAVGEKSSVDHQCNKKSVRINDNQTTESTQVTNSNNNRISVNLVTSQIHELELQEITPPKPLIIFNHVPTPSDSCSVSMDTDENLEQSRPRTSPPRSRSPTPLLEVPFPVKDLTSEMKRPPIN